jgi:hypothetical protein
MINLNNWSVTFPDGKTHYPSFYNLEMYQEKYGLVMKTPCDGTTTKNSKYPRCELREMTNGKKAAWSAFTGTHKFKGTFSVSRFTFVKAEVCVLQIHNGKDDLLQIIVSPDYVKYKYNQYKIVLGTYSIDEKFRIKLKVQNNNLMIKYNFNDYITLPIQGDSLYFKTGNYLQSNDKIELNTSEFSTVVLHEIFINHSL